MIRIQQDDFVILWHVQNIEVVAFHVPMVAGQAMKLVS